MENAEKNKVIEILYDHFMRQYKNDEKKAVAAINYIGTLAQKDGTNLVHFGRVVFMVSVVAKKMVEFHAMIGGNPSESEMLKLLNKELDSLIKYLKQIGVAIAYTHMPTEKEKVFSNILEEYNFTKKKSTDDNGKNVIAFYIALEE